GEEGRPAVRLGIPAGDLVAGMYAAIAINAALADSERGGKGRHIDISMLDCQLAMLSYQSTYALIAGVHPQRQAARHDSIPTYRSFVGGDGRELVITANTERMWQGLCRALGVPELLSDSRFLNGELRLANREALWEILEAAFLRRPAAEWVGRLAEEGVPVALIKTVPEANDDARECGRGMVLPLPREETQIEVVGNASTFLGEPEAAAAYPPRLGEDAHTVLNDWLGWDGPKVQDLLQKKVLSQSV